MWICVNIFGRQTAITYNYLTYNLKRFKHALCLKKVLCLPLLWEMIQFDYCFLNGLKPPTSDKLCYP